MDDQVFVGAIDGLAHLTEEPDARREIEMVRVAVSRDRLALHVLHHEVGHALRRAAVDQPRDVRMLERGQDLPFETESFPQLRRVAVPRRNFQRDGLLVLEVVADRLEHQAHAAVSDLADDAIGAEAPPDPLGAGFGSGCLADRPCDPLASAGMLVEHAVQLTPEVLVARGLACDKRGALVRRQVDRRREQRLQALPALGGEHLIGHSAERAMVWLSQASAVR